MKTLIFTGLLFAALVSHAGKQTKKTLDASQFVKEIHGYLGDMSSGKDIAFRGELSEVGGECHVFLEADSKGRMNIVLKSDKGFKIDTVIFNDDHIKLVQVEDSDGSFSKVYTFGTGGINRLTIVHADDAYDHVTLKAGSTSLSCDADY